MSERSTELDIVRTIRRFVEVDDPGGTLGVLLGALDDLPVGIGLLTVADLRFVYANRLYESWYQLDRRPLVGRDLEHALVAAPQVAETFRRAATEGKPFHFHNAKFVGLRNRPNVLPGDITVWDWSIWPLKNALGKVSHLLVSGYDVTAAAIDRLNAEHAHEEGARAMLEVSRVAGTSGSLEDFFGRLSATVAGVVGAGKVLFATAADGVLWMQPSSYGFDDALLAGITVPCRPDGSDLAERIVFQDEVFRRTIDTSPEFEQYRAALQVMNVSNAIAVSWRVGDLRLGLVAAFNSTKPEGFSEGDVYLLRTAAMAAGLVWQHRQDEARLAEAQEQERERLQSAAAQLASLERAKADFLRLASHEMRGPINVASVYASMLTDGSLGQASPKARDAAMAISEKVRELNRIVDQVLEVSRLEDPSLSLERTTFDLRDVAGQARENVAATARGHSVSITAPPHPVVVHTDRERTLMILQNLLDNALKYSPGGGDVVCTVSLRGGHADVSVADQGIGIAAEDMPRLFGRFTRVGEQETRGNPGTGLGLYLSREAARLLGGDLTVASERGHGSTFKLTLPLAPEPD